MDATIISENVLRKSRLMILYLVVHRLYDASMVISSRPRIQPIIKRLDSRSQWPFFGWSTMRKFSEGPALSIGPFQKVQIDEVIYFSVAEKNENPPQIVPK